MCVSDRSADLFGNKFSGALNERGVEDGVVIAFDLGERLLGMDIFVRDDMDEAIFVIGFEKFRRA